MESPDDFKYFVEQFDDIRVLKYKLPVLKTYLFSKKSISIT